MAFSYCDEIDHETAKKMHLSCYDVDVALEREVEGDLLLSDIGQVSIIIL